ncbi:MAG: S9 family peptidase [Maricaulaceae bacterium]
MFKTGTVICAVAGLAAAAWAEDRVTQGNLVMEGIPDIPADVAETVAKYQNARGAAFRGWTAEGVLISTRFGEVSQLHHVAQPLGAREQLTFYAEPIGAGAVAPDGERLVFAKDVGGAEYFQGFHFDLETKATLRFTEENTRNGGFVWSDDGGLLAWNRVTPGDPTWDVMIGDPRDPDSRRVALEGEGAVIPVDWSDDGGKLLIQQYVSVAKSRLFVLDVETGAVEEINPDLDVAYRGGDFIDDGAAILTVTDHDAEYLTLARIGLEDGAITPLTGDLGWEVEGFDLSPDGQTVVYSVNEAGFSNIRLLNLATGVGLDGPDLPAGLVGGLRFHPDGGSVGFSFNAATAAGDVWSFDVRNMGLTRWTASELGPIAAADLVEPELAQFESFDGLDISAIVYKPKSEGPHPVIVSIHGGPEGQSRPGFNTTAQYWVNELGAAVIYPNVRGSAGYGKTFISLDNSVKREDSVKDIGALLDWIADQDDLDADRVIVYGGSYGGYMVLASMTHYNDRLAGAVNIVGISNFVTFLENTEGYRKDLRRVEYGDERDPEVRKVLEAISPLTKAENITKPMFIIHGFNDPRVPVSEAEQLLEKLKANDTPAWLLIAMDEGHGFRKKSNRDFQRAAETVFLRRVFDQSSF